MGKKSKDAANQNVAFMQATSKGKGALFNIADKKDNGPIMSGSVEFGGNKVQISGFVKEAVGTSIQYLSLSFSASLPENFTEEDKANQIHYYGKLFRQTNEKKYPNSPDYSGFVTVLPCTSANQYKPEEWDAAPVLQVTGNRVRSSDGSARIALNFAPREVADAEVAF